MLAVLILTPLLGLSLGALTFSRHNGLLETLARYFLIGLLGAIAVALSFVLFVILIWPPINIFSFLLPGGFVLTVLGLLYFVRATFTTKSEEVQEVRDE